MRKLLNLLAILSVFLFFTPVPYAHAAWTPIETFDSYTAGSSLNGDSGGSGWATAWSVTAGTVTSATAPAGSMTGKSANATFQSGAARTFTAVNSGSVFFQMQTSATPAGGDSALVAFQDTTIPTNRFWINFGTGNTLQATSNTAGANTIGTYALNTTYLIHVTFTSTTFSVTVNGGATQGPFACTSNNCNINNINMDTGNSPSQIYVDSIGPIFPIVTAPTFTFSQLFQDF